MHFYDPNEPVYSGGLIPVEEPKVFANSEQVIHYLTLISENDPVEDFILVYRLIIDDTSLCAILCKRFQQSFLGQHADFQVVKLRTFVLLRKWIRNLVLQFGDIDECCKSMILAALESIWARKDIYLSKTDKEMLIKVRKLVSLEPLSDNSSFGSGRHSPLSDMSSAIEKSQPERKGSWLKRMGSQLKRSLSRRSASSFGDLPTVMEKGPVLPTKDYFYLLHESSDKISEQWTLMESHLIQSISLNDLLEFREKATEFTNGLAAAFSKNDRFCRWIGGAIFNLRSHEKQAAAIKKLLRIAVKCLGLGNLNTTMQIGMVLQSPMITALAPAWSCLSQYESGLYEELATFTSPQGAFQNVRKAMAVLMERQEPAIPFLGAFTADIIAIKERITMSQEHYGPETVAWTDYRLLASILRDFQEWLDPCRQYKNIQPDQKLLSQIDLDLQNANNFVELF